MATAAAIITLMMGLFQVLFLPVLFVCLALAFPCPSTAHWPGLPFSLAISRLIAREWSLRVAGRCRMLLNYKSYHKFIYTFIYSFKSYSGEASQIVKNVVRAVGKGKSGDTRGGDNDLMLIYSLALSTSFLFIHQINVQMRDWGARLVRWSSCNTKMHMEYWVK